jgi:drug/metabolite transporter (DMT)-like permease
VGFIAGVLACCGIVSLNLAFTNGPAGPVQVISSMYAPCLIVCVAFYTGKMISPLELIGVILGMYGVIFMTFPEFFEKFCFCCCFKKKA